MKHAFGLDVAIGLEEIVDPARCALIIYDMQVAIVRQIPEAPRIVAGCLALLEGARRVGMRTFYTRHVFLPNSAIGVGQLRRAMAWQHKDDPADTKPILLQGAPGWQVIPELAPREGEILIDKIAMSSFEGTFLNTAMRDARLEAFIIAGIALDVGIEPTVRHGLDLNYLPIVAEDACGTKEADVKARSLETLRATGEVMIESVSKIVARLH